MYYGFSGNGCAYDIYLITLKDLFLSKSCLSFHLGAVFSPIGSRPFFILSTVILDLKKKNLKKSFLESL